jgi:hypothetical protein
VSEADLDASMFGPLAGRRILEVEDEYFIAEELSALLAGHGA